MVKFFLSRKTSNSIKETWKRLTSRVHGLWSQADEDQPNQNESQTQVERVDLSRIGSQVDQT